MITPTDIAVENDGKLLLLLTMMTRKLLLIPENDGKIIATPPEHDKNIQTDVLVTPTYPQQWIVSFLRNIRVR